MLFSSSPRKAIFPECRIRITRRPPLIFSLAPVFCFMLTGSLLAASTGCTRRRTGKSDHPYRKCHGHRQDASSSEVKNVIYAFIFFFPKKKSFQFYVPILVNTRFFFLAIVPLATPALQDGVRQASETNAFMFFYYRIFHFKII